MQEKIDTALFFNRKPEILLKWAVALFTVFLLFLALTMGLVTLGKTMADEAVTNALQLSVSINSLYNYFLQLWFGTLW